MATLLGVLVFAYVLRRREHEAYGFDPALATAVIGSRAPASRAPAVAAGSAAEPRVADVPVVPEDAGVPRWRRSSLQAERESAYAGPALPRPPLVFDRPPAPGVERRTVGYRLVRVGDGPDEIRSREVGRLERGDEVEIVQLEGRAAFVRTPDGLEGWIDSIAILRVTDPTEG